MGFSSSKVEGSQAEAFASQPLQIKIAHRFFDRLVLSLLKGFLEFAVKNIFLLAFGHPGIAKFVFALLRLIRKDARRIADVNIRRSSHWRRVREDYGEIDVHREF